MGEEGGVGLGWVGLGQGLTWSPTHGPRRVPCGTRLGGRTWVSSHKAYRTVDHPQTPRWHSRVGDAAVPVCMCPCVSEGLWHTCLLCCCSALAHMAQGSVCLVLQATAGSASGSPASLEMWAWARNLHITRTGYPTAPRLPAGTGRRWYVARLGSDPHSLTAFGTGGAAMWAGSGSPQPRAYPGQVEGPQGAESASALGATGASCTGCGATARVDEGAQRAPHPNGLSVGRGGGGRDALKGKGPQRRVQRRLDKWLEEVAKAVGGGYCRLQMPLRLAFGVRGTVAGHRVWGGCPGGGRGGSPPSNAFPGGGGAAAPQHM